MMPLIDETGKRYGTWRVLRRAEPAVSRGMWVCCCDCGIERAVVGRNLRDGTSAGCGCSRKIAPGEAAFNFLFSKWKLGAARRSIEWALSKDHVRKLARQNCFYCGAAPSYVSRHGGNGVFLYNGLDRVDNLRGYTPANVKSCCGRCNDWKCNYTETEFLAHVFRIYNISISGRTVLISDPRATASKGDTEGDNKPADAEKQQTAKLINFAKEG